MLLWTLRKARQLIVAVVGGTVVVIGILMILTPGPAILVIPLGLGILATEFIWARILLKKVKEHIATMASKINKKPTEERK